MRIHRLSIGTAVLIMISGCISGSVTEVPEDEAQSPVIQQVTEPVEEVQETVEETVQETQEKTVPTGFVASVKEIVTDREVYHSREVMKFNATIEANDDLSGAVVKARGISGKMNIERIVDINEGENNMEFEMPLPSCNRCSGIGAGMHTINVQLYYGELIAGNSASVEIQQ
ncbi:MAG: hypothetical protein JSV63_03840, partial [Candidatus Aenigmatarchaeota archaeon]